MTYDEPTGPVTTIDEIHGEVTHEHASIPDDSGLIRADSTKKILEAHHEGRLADHVPSPDEALQLWVEHELERRARSNSTAVKKVLRANQSLFDLGDEFDLVIIVCNKSILRHHGTEDAEYGRKTTLGLLNADDLLLMGYQSEANERKARRANREIQDALGSAVPKLRAFSNYRSAYEQGWE